MMNFIFGVLFCGAVVGISELMKRYEIKIDGGKLIMRLYRCPECKCYRSGEEWDYSTRKHYSKDELLNFIGEDKDDGFFYCPNCDKEIDGTDILSSDDEDIIITKKEYKELLEYKENYLALCK